MARILRKLTIRMAVEATQGRGWSEYEGESWVSPVERYGCLTVIDGNNVPRHLVIDRNDDNVYEFGTYNRQTDTSIAWVDKEDVDDTEIETAQWFGEECTNPIKREEQLENLVSHVHVRPQNPYNKGNENYDSEGYRNDQSFSLDIYKDGDLARQIASAEEIPQDGDITFSGYKISGRRLMFVFRSDASEFQLIGRSHDMVAKPKQGSTSERTMARDTAELELSDLYYWISRDDNLLFERVGRTTISGTATATDGADARTNSGFTIASSLSLSNTAFTGDYTLILWSKSEPTITGLTLTEYGSPINGWHMYYAQDNGAFPVVTLPAGDYFDIRIYQSQIADASLSALCEDITYNEGNGLLPVF